jgi:hypothetical protein
VLTKTAGGDFAMAWTSLPPQSTSWAALTGKPTTIAGFGITDAQPLSAVLTGSTASFTTAQATKLGGIAAGATVNAPDAALRDRATHTGTQAASTIAGLAAVATTGSAADLATGVLPAGRLDDTAHGNRAGGVLHAIATQTVAGFLSGPDKARIDGMTALVQGYIETLQPNLFPLDFDYPTALVLHSTSAKVAAPAGDLVDRGYGQAISWRAGNEYAYWAAPGQADLFGKYIFSAFLMYSTNPANFPTTGKTFTKATSPTFFDLNFRVEKRIILSPTCSLYTVTGQVNRAGDHTIVVGSTVAPADNTRFATGFALHVSDSPLDSDTFARAFMLREQVRRELVQRATAGQAATVATIAGRLADGVNTTVAGTGTAADPYRVNAPAGGGGTVILDFNSLGDVPVDQIYDFNGG